MPNRKSLIAAAITVGVLGAPQSVLAERTVDVGTSPSADARLNFRVIIPSFMVFRVGSVGGIDTIEFDLSAVDPDLIGSGTPIPGTGGDLTGGQVTAQLLSNAGQVTIGEANDGGGNGLAGTTPSSFIPYTEITALSANAAFTPPALSNAGVNTSTPAPTTGSNITSYDTTWTYSYADNALYTGGTYTGQVTYTASAP